MGKKKKKKMEEMCNFEDAVREYLNKPYVKTGIIYNTEQRRYEIYFDNNKINYSSWLAVDKVDFETPKVIKGFE